MKSTSYVVPYGAVVLLAVLPSLGQAATASDISIPGIPPAGFPSFENNVSITQTRTGSGASAVTTLKAFDDPGSFVFKLNSSQSYNVTNTGYLLSATFNSAGNFTGGNLSITGIVQGYPGAPATVTNLYTANLASFAYDNVNDATPVALGFRTDNWSGWAAQFQQAPESAYLYNFNVIGFVNNLTNPLFKNTTFHGSAVTTVPIPAAAWLFGSALALLAGARRRKSIST